MRGVVWIAVALTFASTVAEAQEIRINGVRVGRVANTTLERCSVRFDEKGNIHIDAPGYEVQSPGTAQAPPPNAAPPGATQAPAPPARPATPAKQPSYLTPAAAPTSTAVLQHRYFLHTSATQPGATRYKFEIFINGRAIRTFGAADAGLTMGLNGYFEPGKNRIRIRATKMLEGGAPAAPADASFDLLIGRGRGEGGTLVIDEAFVRYRRTVSDVGMYDDEFTVVTQ